MHRRDFLQIGCAGAVGLAYALSAKAAPADHTIARARELLYFLREYAVFCRPDSWIQAVYELSQLGPTAVPEIVAELDLTDLDRTRRALPMALRAIGDRRAVPALLRALPKCKLMSSDCGLIISDPVLIRFMQENDWRIQVLHRARASIRAAQGGSIDSRIIVNVGRSVSEIVAALEKVTGRSERREVFPSADSNVLRTLSERWNAWWRSHGHDMLTDAELASISKPLDRDDPVAAAGLAHYGPNFPTGGGVKLGPEIVLDLGTGNGQSWFGSQSVDFDTGRVTDTVTEDRWRHDPKSRMRGVDAYAGAVAKKYRRLEARELHVWRVDEKLWEQIDDIVEQGKPIDIAPYVLRDDFEYLPHDSFPDSKTFLFTTRDGGRGILRIDEKDLKGNSGKIPIVYRMFRIPPGVRARPPRP